MILLFLGSWRSTLIITVSIPLSILASIACLSALGETKTTALQAELSRINILTRRLDASVLLIKALGGGWAASD
jgi:hypothetical protein